MQNLALKSLNPNQVIRIFPANEKSGFRLRRVGTAGTATRAEQERMQTLKTLYKVAVVEWKPQNRNVMGLIPLDVLSVHI